MSRIHMLPEKIQAEPKRVARRLQQAQMFLDGEPSMQEAAVWLVDLAEDVERISLQVGPLESLEAVIQHLCAMDLEHQLRARRTQKQK